MNSVRPLVTITILVVVGAYLYSKINEGPARPQGSNEIWRSDAPQDVPPLDTSAGTSTSTGDTAPAWPATGQAEQSIEPTTEAVATALNTLPAVPAIPELPEVTTSQVVTTSATNSVVPAASATAPLDLPANVPAAQYPDQPSTNQLTGVPGETTPALPTAESVADSAAVNPLRPATAQAEMPNQYTSVYGQNQTAAGASGPPQATLAASWPEIQAALDRGELSRAHELLSAWHNDPTLHPADSENVDALLGQLAGTVVYSTEHQLEPARVVRAGETLETIAKEYNVSWQLLAKINGIPAADQVRVGQELKVVRGPFSAVVDLNRKQLTLMLGDRYAGKFAVTPPENAAGNEGDWIVVGGVSAPQQGTPQRVLMLNREEGVGPQGQGGILLGAVSVEQLRQHGTIILEPVVGLSLADADEVSDILSVGSRVVIRR